MQGWCEPQRLNGLVFFVLGEGERGWEYSARSWLSQPFSTPSAASLYAHFKSSMDPTLFHSARRDLWQERVEHMHLRSCADCLFPREGCSTCSGGAGRGFPEESEREKSKTTVDAQTQCYGTATPARRCWGVVLIVVGFIPRRPYAWTRGSKVARSCNCTAGMQGAAVCTA